ncbi:MAG: RecD-like DNA helicase YrrC [Ktedonobacterales bacterium]|jgi:exodeoxyribonuclease V alpha subunit|nr:MAG: RecD-like DNA helicase YrrC [Ktedonobacterales bacterium]
MPTLPGTLERIVFRNQETQFTVARLRLNDSGRLFRDDLVTLVGALPGVSAGELIEVTGEWELHPQHGRHLRVKSFTSHAPVTATGLRRYLGSGVIKGVGPKTAERIVEHFGEQTLAVIELEPERLAEVKGISVAKRELIVRGWAEQQGVRDLMIFLQEHEVSPALATKIYRQYGKDSIKVVRETPYTLERDVHGIGFRTADALAVKLGLPRDSQPRYMTGIKHVLSEVANSDGHCYLPREELFIRAAALLDAPADALESALMQLVAEKEAFVEEDHVYLAPFFYAESGTARRLRVMLKAPSDLPSIAERAWNDTFTALEHDLNLHLAERQKEAVRVAYCAKVSVLTGGPGVGKTTAIRALLDTLDRQGVAYALAAPTGRAAKRMTEATGRPAKTLHRLLEFLPSANDFAYNEHRPLPQSFIIVDEVSMLDLLLAYRLVKALRAEAHVLLVGDADQLPSVGPGSVFADILASEAVPAVRLTELFRQARESAIIVTAHGVNEGRVPSLQPDPTGDFFFLRADDPAAAQRLIVDLVGRRLPARYGFDPVRDIQVLAPMYRGHAGVIALNSALQARLNPHAEVSVAYGEHTLRPGDKVMQVRNNYDKGPTGIFNGDVGRIVEIARDTSQVAVHFADEAGGVTVTYEPHELDELALAYACSIHRAQGSEYPCVVLPLVNQHYLLLQRNLLYTAITRARRLCVVVGDPRALRRAVENNALAARNTGLAERLRGSPLAALEPRESA